MLRDMQESYFRLVRNTKGLMIDMLKAFQKYVEDLLELS